MNLKEVKIRRVKKKDITILVEYRLNYLEEIQGKRDKIYQKKLQNELMKYFTKAIAENRFIAFMAEAEGKPVGFGGMVIKEIPGDFNKSSYLEGDILNMYTVPEARRQGISSLILKKLLQEAKEMGISKVALHTTKEGEKGYRARGFSEPEYPYLELELNSEIFSH